MPRISTFLLYWLVLLAAPAGAVVPAAGDSYLQFANSELLDEKVYIVQLASPPAMSLKRPERISHLTGQRVPQSFDADDFQVRQYSRRLTESHDALLDSVGAYGSKLYSYRYTFNGFAARMTAAQAQKLRNRKSVLRVWEDQVRYLQTNDSPSFLGLLNQAEGLRTARGLQGEGVVIGVIDSGITPEHPSFADTREADRPRICRSSWSKNSLLGLWLCKRFRNRDDVLVFDPPEDWNGHCEPGERFESTDCNNKIIGARFYIDGFLESHALDDNEFLSPRDADGHGTHIASTAAGNEVRASIAGTSIARISGIAPRARVAVYKACWLEPGQIRASCSTADLQRAIEDAVADGVDIINYSVGNTDISLSDPDDLALLTASDAGVLGVVAGGNDGPDALGNILSPSGAPWVLTVAASSRAGEKYEEAVRVNAPSAVAGDYVSREAAFTPELSTVGPLTEELVLVDDEVAASTTYDACETIVNTGELSGRIAFLQRGGCDFEVKISNVETAGAVAAVVFDNVDDPIIMAGTRGSVDIPAVMIGRADGQQLLEQLQSDEVVEITLDKTNFLKLTDAGDVMGKFSSTGPNLTAPDILKPDVTAPGVDILAGQTPDVANGVQGENFQYLSGTSMAVPHVAGIAALLKEANPQWSPAALKSALMTTARQNVFKQNGETPADPFDFGSGHVEANHAADPGLVYDAGKADYDAFSCGTDVPRVSAEECAALVAAGYSSDGASLNLPSIAVSSLVSRRTVRRRLTNVGGPSQYRVSVTEPPGIRMTVTPETLSLGNGESGEYEIEFSGDGAEPFFWQFGELSWDDGEHSVRSPVAARPVPFLAPLEVTGEGVSGTLGFDIEFGYSGDYNATVHGLVPADTITSAVQDDPQNNYVPVPLTGNLPSNVDRLVFDVPDNAVYLRVSLRDEDTDGDDDLDLYLYGCQNEFFCDEVGLGGRFDSNEQIDILFPFEGEYYIDVHGFNTDEVTGGPGAVYTLSVWVIGADDDRGNLSVIAPNVAIPGNTDPVSVNWSGLDAVRYLGGITHANAPGLITRFNDDRFLEFTLIEIDR